MSIVYLAFYLFWSLKFNLFCFAFQSFGIVEFINQVLERVLPDQALWTGAHKGHIMFQNIFSWNFKILYWKFKALHVCWKFKVLLWNVRCKNNVKALIVLSWLFNIASWNFTIVSWTFKMVSGNFKKENTMILHQSASIVVCEVDQKSLFLFSP